ncbi:hypothetical protein HDU97_003202 [Phlyctochytrium planicorne]|nr:hypothetical protein HDU97_003202 [Phlyctochytrium planicorne]
MPESTTGGSAAGSKRVVDGPTQRVVSGKDAAPSGGGKGLPLADVADKNEKLDVRAPSAESFGEAADPLVFGAGAKESANVKTSSVLKHMSSVTLESCLLPDNEEEDNINYDKVNYTLKNVPYLLNDSELEMVIKSHANIGRPIASPTANSSSTRMLAAAPPTQQTNSAKSNLTARQRLDRLSYALQSQNGAQQPPPNFTHQTPTSKAKHAPGPPNAPSGAGNAKSAGGNQARADANTKGKALEKPAPPLAPLPPQLTLREQRLLDAVDSVSEPLVITSRRRRSRYADFLRREFATSGALGWGRAGVGAPGSGAEYSCFFCEFEQLFGGKMWKARRPPPPPLPGAITPATAATGGQNSAEIAASAEKTTPPAVPAAAAAPAQTVTANTSPPTSAPVPAAPPPQQGSGYGQSTQNPANSGKPTGKRK